MEIGLLTIPLFAAGLLAAVASGFVSSFLVLRRMTLMSDALSHVALPGIALGLLFHFQPLIGGLVFLFVGVIAIWKLEFQTKLAAESLTGVIFTTALAIGALMASQADLLEAFFGDISKITSVQIAIQSLLALVVIYVAWKYLRQIVLFSIAPDLASSVGLSPARLELVLLLLIAATIAIGVGFVGVLLMSSLLIMPAASARQIAKTFKSFVSLSVALAVIGLLGGLILALVFKIQPGIATVLISAALFIFSLLVSRK